MGFEVGLMYEHNKEQLALKIKRGELKGIPVLSCNGIGCYFCRGKIDGQSEVIIVEGIKM